MPAEYNGYKINLVDVPGNDDFIYEAIGVTRLVKGAILVVDALKKVEVETVKHYKMLRKRGIPTLIFVNKMDKEGLYWIDNATDLLGMIEYIDHPLCHAVWDVGHANMQDMSQDEALRILGGHIRGLHVHDNMGDADTHLAPFLGTASMDAVMSGLKDIGYDGYFTFEIGGFFTPADKKRSFARNTSLAAAPSELRDAFERYLYEMGKCILEKYGCFEE